MAFGSELTPTQGGLIDTGAGIISTAVNAWLQTRENQKNRDFNAEQAELAYQRQIALQDKQNAYNSPVAQMQRYKEAGLNPNIVAGQQNLSAPAASAPIAAGASGSVSALPFQTNMLDAALADAQIKNLNAQTKMTFEQANTIVRMREVTYNKINAESELLSQQFRQNQPQALVADIKSQMLQSNINASKERGDDIWNESNTNLVDYGNGDLLPLITCISDTFTKELDNSRQQAIYFIDSFLADLGLKQANKKYQEMLNDDMKEWLKVCETVYQGQGSQASFISAMSEMNEDFYRNLGSAPEAVKWIAQFLSVFMNVLPNVNFSHSTKSSTFNKNVTYSD